MRASLILLLAGLLSGTAPAAAGPAVAFLSASYADLERIDVLPDLKRAGCEVGVLSWAQFTAEDLQRFNVVVITDMPGVDEKGELPAAVTQRIGWLDGYLRGGGGIIMSAGSGGWDLVRPAVNRILQPYGAELLNEQVTDPAHLYRHPRGVAWHYSWTTQIAQGPLSEGVATFWYPALSFRADGIKTTFAMKVDDAWHVAVRGMASARSVRNVAKTGEMEAEPATYASAPPLVACRAVGAGRLVLLPIWPNWTFWGAHCKPLEEIVWSRGDGTTTSDGGRLILNALGWLAEPSLAAGKPGGYTAPPAGTPRPDPNAPEEIDWSKATFPEPPAGKTFTLLIGARTAYSSGSGTVADYCRAARAAGYDGVLFAETLERLTPDAWERLRADCARETAEQFLALPGMDYRTLQGDEYVAFGDFPFPTAPGLAADGKHIDDTYQFWARQTFAGLLAATRLHAHPERDPQILKNMTACAVYTYQGGKVVDDSLDHYLALDAQWHNLVPITLHLLGSPAEVAAAAKTGLQTRWRAPDTAALKEAIAPHREFGLLYWLNPHPVYLSSGPTLEEWSGINLMYWRQPGLTTDRYRMRFAVSSANPVVEARVLNRGKPMLRFAGAGNRLHQTFEGHHVEQHVFHLIARDAKGGRLISPGVRVRFGEAYVNQCGDHQNTISACFQRNAKGRMIYTWGTTMAVYAGWPPRWSVPCPVDPTEDFPPDWDGGGTGAGGAAAPMVRLEGGRTEGGPELGASNLFEVAGPEVQILTQVVRHKYPEGTPPRSDCMPTYRTVPTECFDTVVRRVTPTARFGRPGLSLTEITLTAKQDLKLDPKQAMPVVGYELSDYGNHKEGLGDQLFLTLADGRRLHRVGPAGAKAWYGGGDMAVGDYAAAYPNRNGAAALFPLTPIAVDAVLNERLLACLFGLRLPGKTIRKGETLKMAFLGVSPATTVEEGNQPFEEVRRSLGIGVPPAYEATATRGRILSRTGFLRAEATGGAFAARLTQAPMAVDLPVAVSGLNDRWAAARQVNGGRLKAITVSRGTAYTNLDLGAGKTAVAIGHPVVCDEPDLPVSVWWDADGWRVRVHNPREQAVQAVVRANPAFHKAPPGFRKVTIPAGTTVDLLLRLAPAPAGAPGG